jgi:hypothetical protein
LVVSLEPDAGSVPVWFEFQLHMRTAKGKRLSTTYKVLPETTTIQLQSWPATTTFLVNQEATSDQVTLIVGQHYILEAPKVLFYKGEIGKFKNWVVTESWDGAHSAGETLTIPSRRYDFVASEPPVTYIAFYDYEGPAYLEFLPKIDH